MAAATSSTLGTVLLAGDLAGSTDANSPALTPVGVTPGSYSNIGALVVDSKGRIIDVGNSINLDIDSFPCADGSTCGVVKVGQNFNISGGVLSVPDATSSVAGVVKVGSGFVITNTCQINVDYPKATSTTLGLVAVPTAGHLSVDSSGNVSLPKATASTLGGVKLQIGGAFSIDGSGNLSTGGFNIATATTKGIVIVPTSGNLSVDGSGNLSVALATNTVVGLVKPNNTVNITIVSGNIALAGTAPTVKTSTNNAWTKSQNITPVALTYSASITPDFSAGDIFTLSVTGNTTLNAPTNYTVGGIYYIQITQDSTGRIVSTNSVYKFPYNSNNITTIPNKTTILQIICESSTSFLCINLGTF